MLQNQSGEVLLIKRPTKGIWGGLWSFPECSTLIDIAAWYRQHLNRTVPKWYTWKNLHHTFTHFHLDITPVLIPIEKEVCRMVALKNIVWYNPTQPQTYGLSAPVARLLVQLTQFFIQENKSL